MKKVLFWFFIVLLVISALIGAGFFLFFYPVYIKNITYEVKEDVITAHISFYNFYIEGECFAKDKSSKIENKECIIEVPNENNEVKIKTQFQESSIIVNPKVDEVIDFEVSETEVYLAINEHKKVSVSVERLGNPDLKSTFISGDENILRIENDELIGVSSGVTTVTVKVGNIEKNITVTVSDLYHLPVLETKKTYMQCGIHSPEQNELLDKVLKYKINRAGYQTRAGVVAALRFLTLEFPYQLNYFFENGRINNNTGGGKVDGEGRYYHKGLYLSSYKFNEIQTFPGEKRWGPTTWGCPLYNWQDEAGFKPGVKYPNGLDCSGFITWGLLNGGFDVSDTGAGDNPERNDDLSDLGGHVPITRSLLESGTLKAGDIIATDGHIAMIGGLKDQIVYVAESTTYYNGVVMHPYTFDELLSTDKLTYIIYMDEYYQTHGNGNGNYTAYWE